MSENAIETLFYGFDKIGISLHGQQCLFLNARFHEALPPSTACVQWFKPPYDHLSEFMCYGTVEEVQGEFDSAFLLFPKNIIEGQYLIAKAFSFLKEGGQLFVVAENKAGGSRLPKILQQFGGELTQSLSKHKCRFVQVTKHTIHQGFVETAFAQGNIQTIEKTGFLSQAGVYGWDKIDQGSKILLEHIPQDLKGSIADFGCGYGYLLQHVLAHNQGIKKAFAIDADARALRCARQNLKDFDDVEYLWSDLTKNDGIPTKLDTIIMNPPFHDGKIANSDIGVSFIRKAAAALQKGGALFMVANTHLPYESVLEEVFSSYEKLAQDNGFKVFKAVA